MKKLYKIKNPSVFITNMHFPEVTIGLSKENKSNILLKIKKVGGKANERSI